MTNEITITFPAIPAQVIAELKETETMLAASELEFVASLRSRYGSLAKQNGHIKISHYEIGNQNWQESGDTYLTDGDGAKVKALLASDFFSRSNSSEFNGSYTGEKLYLHEDGWIEITRSGRWSNYQGSDDYWTCDGRFADEKEFECGRGTIRHLTDAQVADEYDVKGIAETFAKTLADLAQKLPERLSRKRALAESLQSVVAQLAK